MSHFLFNADIVEASFKALKWNQDQRALVCLGNLAYVSRPQKITFARRFSFSICIRKSRVETLQQTIVPNNWSSGTQRVAQDRELV